MNSVYVYWKYFPWWSYTLFSNKWSPTHQCLLVICSQLSQGSHQIFIFWMNPISSEAMLQPMNIFLNGFALLYYYQLFEQQQDLVWKTRAFLSDWYCKKVCQHWFQIFHLWQLYFLFENQNCREFWFVQKLACEKKLVKFGWDTWFFQPWTQKLARLHHQGGLIRDSELRIRNQKLVRNSVHCLRGFTRDHSSLYTVKEVLSETLNSESEIRN